VLWDGAGWEDHDDKEMEDKDTNSPGKLFRSRLTKKRSVGSGRRDAHHPDV